MGVKEIKRGAGRPRKYTSGDIEKFKEELLASTGTDLSKLTKEQIEADTIYSNLLASVISPKDNKSNYAPTGDKRLSANIKKEIFIKLKNAAEARGLTIGRMIEILTIEHL